eukprot:4239114-Prymnesium_polylepis.1
MADASASPNRRASGSRKSVSLRRASSELNGLSRDEASVWRRRIEQITSTLTEAQDAAQSPEARLRQLGQRKAASALEGISQEELDKFRELRLVRIPAPTVEVIVCCVCTLVQLGGPAVSAGPKFNDGKEADRQKLQAWNDARLVLGRPDLRQAIE